MSSIAPPDGSGRPFATTNASGTIISTARPLGTAPPINLADPSRDHNTIVDIGCVKAVTIKAALAMGALKRQGATLSENYATLQGSGFGGTSPTVFGDGGALP